MRQQHDCYFCGNLAESYIPGVGYVCPGCWESAVEGGPDYEEIRRTERVDELSQ